MNPLFITAHYDDLEVCAGGTAKRYGGQSIVLFPRENYGTQKEVEQAADYLGICLIPLQAEPNIRNTITLIDETLKSFGDFNTIISVSPHDSHPEHQAAASLARQLARKNNKALWFMDHTIPGGYGQGPRPNHFVNISDEAISKYKAIRAYKGVVKLYGNNWLPTISSRDKYYGGIHEVYAAEGFTVQDSMQ